MISKGEEESEGTDTGFCHERVIATQKQLCRKDGTMKKIFVACLAGLCLLAFCPVVGAADFPTGPITYIIPFNPGGQSDVEARLQQPYLEKLLGTSIIVEYKPGAGGALAWTQFSKAKPDGYTVCGINIPHIILQDRKSVV